jgi:UDP-2,3-diacylglucosamine hydrolase
VATLFISDLHLEDSRPEITGSLLGFLSSETCINANALYVLGDLFEFWIGDDVVTETASKVAAAFHQLDEKGVPCLFMHGNRDFLIGESYAAAAGLELLPESVRINLYGIETVLLHGDTLCTDDQAYQQFRQQVRNPQWQKSFLAMPLERRLEMALSARDASMKHTTTAEASIMDVNESAVLAAFEEHGVTQMIHGHTHRPAVHDYHLPNGVDGQRIVLSDWYESGTVLRVDAEGFTVIPVQG